MYIKLFVIIFLTLSAQTSNATSYSSAESFGKSVPKCHCQCWTVVFGYIFYFQNVHLLNEDGTDILDEETCAGFSGQTCGTFSELHSCSVKDVRVNAGAAATSTIDDL